MKAFFRGWLNTDLDKINWKKAKLMVLYSEIPEYIKLNVMEGLDVLENGRPPPNCEILID